MGISLLEEVGIPTFLADFIMATLQLFQSHGQALSEAEVFVRSQETLSQMTVSLIVSILIQIGQETNYLNGIVRQVVDCPSMTIVLILPLSPIKNQEMLYCYWCTPIRLILPSLIIALVHPIRKSMLIQSIG